MTEPLHLASGEIAACQSGQYVGPDQGEWWQMGSQRNSDIEPPSPQEFKWSSIDAQIGVTQLADGTWLARPPGLGAWDPRFPTREAALRRAVAGVIRRVRFCRRADCPAMLRINDAEQADTIIAWAYRVLGQSAPKMRDNHSQAAAQTESRLPSGQMALFAECG